ncbi:MAG: BON domain-containing protein [Planctomycetota bacterium]|nr:BON domain-containing protein [Planctomycetota bacterium]
MKRFFLLAIACCLGGLSGCSETSTPANRAPDNTGVNVRDRDDAAKTPINQNENAADVKMTADIRKKVVDTKLSINAHNIKIITQNGQVTLRGPVDSADEKQQLESIAKEVAGPGKVDNQLEVP